MNKLLTFYHAVLPALGLEAEADGKLVHPSLTHTKFDFSIDGKNVYLPSDELLDKGDWRSKIGFHPLCESIARGRSEMLTALLGSMVYKSWNLLSYLIVQVAKVAAKQETDEMKRISPKLADFLSNIQGVNENTVTWLTKLVDIAGQAQDERFLVKFYLKHGGNLKGVSYSRICTVYSPFLEELKACSIKSASQAGKIPVWGVEPPRKKDVDIALAIFSSILPGLEDDRYSQGSSAGSAPYFTALLESVNALLSDVNKVVLNLKGHFADEAEVSYLYTDLSWYNNLPDFNVIRRLVPILEYNEGVVRDNRDEAGESDRDVSTDRPSRPSEASRDVLPPTPATPPPLLGRVGSKLRLEPAYDPVVERERERQDNSRGDSWRSRSTRDDRDYRDTRREEPDDLRRGRYRETRFVESRDYDRRDTRDNRDYDRRDRFVARSARDTGRDYDRRPNYSTDRFGRRVIDERDRRPENTWRNRR